MWRSVDCRVRGTNGIDIWDPGILRPAMGRRVFLHLLTYIDGQPKTRQNRKNIEREVRVVPPW